MVVKLKKLPLNRVVYNDVITGRPISCPKIVLSIRLIIVFDRFLFKNLSYKIYLTSFYFVLTFSFDILYYIGYMVINVDYKKILQIINKYLTSF